MWNILKILNEYGIKHLDSHGSNFLINNNQIIVITNFGHSLSELFDYSDEYYIKQYNNDYIDKAMNNLEELYDKSLKVF